MKTYKIIFEVATESDTNTTVIDTFEDYKLAEKRFKQEVKTAYRGKETDYNCKEYLTEAIKLEKYIDNEHEDTELCQVIYSEGSIDRMNYKGDYAVMYYSYAVFNGKELMHEMFFQGKKENWGKKRKVPHSQLSNWYFR